MSWAAVIVGGSAVVGGVIASQSQKNAANKASDASQYGTDQSVNLQRYMYDQSRSDFSPYQQVGTQALYDAFGYSPQQQTYYPPGTSNQAMQMDPAMAAKLGYAGGTSSAAVQPGQQMVQTSAPTTYGSDPWGQFQANRAAGTGAGLSPAQYALGAEGRAAYDQNVQQMGQSLQQQGYLGGGGQSVVAGGGGQATPQQMTSYVKSGPGIDPTGGSGQYLDMLESLKFQMNPTDDIYKWREEQTNKAVNQAAAARGMYNSRPTINALGDANMALQSDEINRQYQMNYKDPYAKYMDLYNMATQQGQLKYGTALDAIKAGQGAAGSMGQLGANAAQGISSAYMNNAGNQANIAMQQGDNQANLWAGLGAMPMNYMNMQNMFGTGGSSSWSGLGGTANNTGVPSGWYGSQYR